MSGPARQPAILAPAAGYAHPAYAHSLAGFGKPVNLPGCGGWLLERPIPGSAYLDAAGPYPLFACRDWSRLAADLELVGDRWVSVGLVPDPFGDYTPGLLQQAFPDLVRPFKQHFVVDLRQDPQQFVCEHHRRNARRALQPLTVERLPEPTGYLDEWVSLYRVLAARHAIRGPAAFSPASFASQLAVPGLTAFRAVHGGNTVGMALFYQMERVAYYHLAASDEAGYRLGASYGLLWRAIEYFAGAGLEWLDLGGGAGVRSVEGGLARFKRGWASGTRQAYFCGRIGHLQRYGQLSNRVDGGGSSYFPAYRQGEFS
jgi:hypothetical protein